MVCSLHFPIINVRKLWSEKKDELEKAKSLSTASSLLQDKLSTDIAYKLREIGFRYDLSAEASQVVKFVVQRLIDELRNELMIGGSHE